MCGKKYNMFYKIKLHEKAKYNTKKLNKVKCEKITRKLQNKNNIK